MKDTEILTCNRWHATEFGHKIERLVSRAKTINKGTRPIQGGSSFYVFSK